MARLGLDFGTSNTAAGVMAAGRPYAIPLEPGAQTLPTAVFVDFAERKFIYGSAAARAMMDGQDGRFMRALKSILGTSLAQEKRSFLQEKLTLVEIIARFLAEIRHRAETQTGLTFDTAVSGRPVRFHSEDADKDARAQEDLRQAYELAGFRDVSFLPEPEAAALAVAGEGRLLIVDIGGGTSDFTYCAREGADTRVLASRGLRIGGTDFDKTLSLGHAMPLLGYGAEVRDAFSGKARAVPRAPFLDLASWEKIAFVYEPALLRDVRGWGRLAQDPVLFERLADVLEAHLGHDVAYAVEAGKIAANGNEAGLIKLDVVERGLSASLTFDAVNTALTAFADRLHDCALDTLQDAGAGPGDVDQVVFVGGSSLMTTIRAAMSRAIPDAKQVDAEVFTAVVHGLAIAAEDEAAALRHA